MKLFYDLRLGYLVTAPGQDSALTQLQAKAGDTEEVIVQFGRSSDPTGTQAILEAPTWTAENLAGGTVITIGLKQDGKYSDGPILASTSTFTHNSTDKLYTFSLNLNTTAINTALERVDTVAADDIASLDCNFEVTFQIGGSGGWRSSVFQVPFTIYHDILGGSEGTPADADDPDEYLLKAAGIEYLSTTTSRTGGTSADLDYIPTISRTVGNLVSFYDLDTTPDELKIYRLEAGTTAESDPDIIRPDDYNASTNAKFWRLLKVSGTGGISELSADPSPQLGGTLDTNAKQVRLSKGADVASASTLTLGTDGNYFDITGTTAITSIATLGVGTVVCLHFDAALTLTHHATDLVLPGGANITTAANDEAEFVEYATGDWRCTRYQKANGAAVSSALTSPGYIGGVSPNGATFTDLDITSSVSLPQIAVGSLPGGAAGDIATVTNGSSSGGSHFNYEIAVYDGSNWRYMNGDNV